MYYVLFTVGVISTSSNKRLCNTNYTLEQTEGTIKYGQARETIRIGYKTHNYD
jgi:hypothetical protein